MASAQIALKGSRSLYSLISITQFSNSFSCRTVKSIRLVNSYIIRQYGSALTGRLYSDKHEWVELNGDVGTVGISKYAQEALGDVVFAQLPEVGRDIIKDEEVGALESVKAASELYSPVSGKITEKNLDVENTPGLINQSCYEKGWLFRLKLVNLEELKDLMTEDQYAKFLASEP